ncbi:hemerythrin domain-containing protein [Micromonospora profundi]|uniref:Hemerythrin domain-containing protein n=1 Tax=Micromonospora profundi TaxID=1420889 RepID=A0AAJ6L3Q4_9ACTN|nr:MULTISPECIES: hemerythrin domain-containing protein [Micromonospora]KOX05529.1 hemerythrin [Micromonospora sp. NRRL B-16802]NJC15003.1 hemerythrin superfamily protein [Micromonospora profundi]WLS46541.1 hemerythrin domain-containing protein [Micromonospora profundi]
MSNPQTVDDQDVVDILVTDHHEVEALFVELETRQGTPEYRRQLVDVVISELVRHAIAEEAYVYPTARKALPDGDQIAEHEIAEHADAERTMKDLESVDPSDPRFDELLAHLTSTIRHHVQEEENDLFPRLRAATAREELVELAGKVTAIKKIAPTRPHPSAPDRPPANKLLAPGTGLVDRVRDALSGRPTSMDELREGQH